MPRAPPAWLQANSPRALQLKGRIIVDVQGLKRLLMEVAAHYAWRGYDGVTLFFAARLAAEEDPTGRMARVALELFQERHALTGDEASPLRDLAQVLDRVARGQA